MSPTNSVINWIGILEYPPVLIGIGIYLYLGVPTWYPIVEFLQCDGMTMPYVLVIIIGGRIIDRYPNIRIPLEML